MAYFNKIQISGVQTIIVQYTKLVMFSIQFVHYDKDQQNKISILNFILKSVVTPTEWSRHHY